MLLYSGLLCFLVECFNNRIPPNFKTLQFRFLLLPESMLIWPHHSVSVLANRFFSCKLCDTILLCLVAALDDTHCGLELLFTAGWVCLLKNSLLRNAKRNQLLELIYTFVNFYLDG